MQLIDMHCDTLGKLLFGEMTPKEYYSERKLSDTGKDLMHNDFAVSIPGMRQAGTVAQFFACFTYLPAARGGYDECYAHVLRMIEVWRKQCIEYEDDIAPACSYEDLLKNEKSGKISAFLTVEEGGILNGNMNRLEELFRQGVRLLTPVWNFENCIGYPNSREANVMTKGLKPFGREAVEYAFKLGMILDVSHASDGTFHDILECSKGPVIASHSNCRALCDHPRNLTDEMIKKLSEAGGIAGLNLYGMFLGGSNESKMEDMTAHLKHMIQKGGSEFPAIGTDFDGFDGMEREDIPSVRYMDRLWTALKSEGLSESQLDKIFRKNAENVLKRLSVS